MKRIDATCEERTPEGSLVSDLYYGGVLARLLTDNEYSGYPHNGGCHTLYLSLSPQDLKAFLEAVKEHYSKKGPLWSERVEAFIERVNESSQNKK